MDFVTFWATGFGVGKFPRAPGTWGTLITIPFIWLFGLWGQEIYMILTFIFVLFAIYVSSSYELKHKTHDASEIVIDEMAGFLVTMVALPLNIKTLVLGFVLFRLFDIYKPYPISRLDKEVQGGFGVVVDDVAAGLLSSFLLQVLWSQTEWLI